ncbi:sn-glycerol 3-phosphate transport system permease protein [Mesorhizobium sp. J18]|uniref:sn-glycerol-3-phosphate ABC transporter permease UgpA n=1 Tax=Mesorhizobium sp. J18 TaxID=935263 RepID=UPI00119AB0D4|nr:sn-glycerol-3-phosphate ABC transporter permease UgpA [Mesorhizobium sp. J18]TWG99913.1 sn-glycerol 3-phosphate transport system permease protein [Mesorhizobium sp. J18]
MEKRVTFDNRLLPYLLLLPQLLVTIVFFFWPAGQALYQSLLLPDPFGLGAQFVWFSNFEYLAGDRYYLQSFVTTAVFTFFVTLVSMSAALLLAAMADQVIKGAGTYKTLLIWPYAVAPAVAGVMWLFMFQPSIGVLAFYMKAAGFNWNPILNSTHAMTLVIAAAAWKQISYNFLFFLAGMQAIPRSLIEAAAIDGAGKWHRFRTIIFPLLSPTTFFLLVVNIVYAFFETFGIIHTMTSGGPGQSTNILVYKVFSDGFVGQDLGSSAAQSVILMVVVGLLTFIQFRYIERRVHY